MLAASARLLAAPVLSFLALSSAASAPARAEHFRFEEQRVPVGASGPYAAVVGDFTGDGLEDLFVSVDQGVRLLTRKGPREFAPSYSFDLDLPRGLATADFDENGRLDVAVTVRDGVAVFLADGKGGFETRFHEAGFVPFSVATADLDGDGHADLAVANEANTMPWERDEVTVLFGDGKGGVRRLLALLAGDNPSDVRVADLDRDGRPDLVSANWASADLSVFRNLGGRFGEELRLRPGEPAPVYAVATADLDGDGDGDIVAGHAGGGVRAFLQVRPFVFEPGPWGRAGVGLRSVAVADLDGDGLPDVATANTSANSVSLLRGDGKGGFAPSVPLAVGERPRTVALADLDGDGPTDLVVANLGSGDLSLLWNRSSEGAAGREAGDEGKRGAPTPRSGDGEKVAPEKRNPELGRR
ncbi:MAG: hypothetical protein KatS3mg076_1652 [Candidatus Binatia bacterium]|nr:MAG: hypothetical protein KatS3mg076_1652 [Candidatus Binatia bacterium]